MFRSHSAALMEADFGKLPDEPLHLCQSFRSQIRPSGRPESDQAIAITLSIPGLPHTVYELKDNLAFKSEIS